MTTPVNKNYDSRLTPNSATNCASLTSQKSASLASPKCVTCSILRNCRQKLASPKCVTCVAKVRHGDPFCSLFSSSVFVCCLASFCSGLVYLCFGVDDWRVGPIVCRYRVCRKDNCEHLDSTDGIGMLLDLFIVLGWRSSLSSSSSSSLSSSIVAIVVADIVVVRVCIHRR